MDSPVRRLPALLLILLVGLAPAAGAFQPVGTDRPADPPEGPAPGRAGPVDGHPLLSATLVASPLELHLEPRRDVVASNAEPVAGRPCHANSTTLLPEPRVRRSAPPPVFLIHCSFLC